MYVWQTKKRIIKISKNNSEKSAQNPIIFACFQPILLIEFQIFISIVNITANLKNINFDMSILKNDMEKLKLSISTRWFWQWHISMEILRNINIDKISNQLEFDISNRAKRGSKPICTTNFNPVQIRWSSYIFRYCILQEKKSFFINGARTLKCLPSCCSISSLTK